MSESASDWATFWDQPHSIYVNARHFDVHYRDIADAIVALLPPTGARVLDYGCGEALHAGRVAAAAGALMLCEVGPHVRDRLKRRFVGNAKVAVLAPEDVERLAPGSVDLVVANSLAQYLTPAELDRLLGLWRDRLAPGGALIVGDVIPPHVGPLTDTLYLLRYAARNGFVLAVVGGVIRTLFSPYLKMRASFSRYSEAEFLAKLRTNGFSAERLARNLEHNQARMSFRATPR